jgi:hypothetical protein
LYACRLGCTDWRAGYPRWRWRPLSPAVNAGGVTVLARCKHITQPPVLIGVDLAAGKALVQDAQCIVAAVLLTSVPELGRRVAPVTRAYTAQISRPQNAIMPTHIRATCQKGQPALPYQNIITINSSRPRVGPGSVRKSRVGRYTHGG